MQLLHTPELTYLVVHPTMTRINRIKMNLETTPEVGKDLNLKKKKFFKGGGGGGGVKRRKRKQNHQE